MVANSLVNFAPAWAETLLPALDKSGTAKSYEVTLSLVTRDYTDAKGKVFNLYHLRLSNINPQHVTRWLSHMSKYAWGTRSQALSICRRFLKTGVEWGWITPNPAIASTVKLQRKTATDKRVKYLNLDLN